MWFLAIVLAGLLVAIFRLTTRYQYGRKSQRLLLLDLAGSVVLGLALARYFFLPGATGVYLVLGGLGIGILVFIVAAVVTAEVLRKARQRVFDERLGQLRARELSLQRDLDTINRDMRAELRRREETDRAGQATEHRLRGRRERIERWKLEGGAARIRSIKVDEWDQEFRSLDPAARAARREGLEKELAQGPEPGRREHLEIMLDVLDLASEAAPAEAASEEPGTSDQVISSLARKRREIEAEMATTRSDLADAQRKLAEFLAREIALE